jgi:hypothetical protein
MLFHVEHGFRGRVWDLDLNKHVPKVISLDTERGELEAYQTDAAGQIKQDVNGNYLTYRARGRFKFIPENGKPARIVMGAPACALCQSPLTIPGSDLCAFCNAKDKGVKNFKVERLTPLLNRPCEKCSNLAEWSVSDEVTATPQLVISTYPGINRRGKVLFERATTVRQRFYCSRHYVAPRLLDARGEVIEVFKDAGGVRPQ